MNSEFNFFELPGKDNRMIRGSLHIANSDVPKPWFIFCHGITSQRMGPSYLFVKMSRYLAKHGYSSARFDFFGSGESDGEFYEMNLETMKDDVKNVTNYIRDIFSPVKIIILGHSLGGMVAALSTLQSRPDGLVLIAPVASCEKLLAKKECLMKNGLTVSGNIAFGAHELGNTAFDSINNVDPLENLRDNFKGKLLVIQGSDDISVPVEESKAYINTAQKSSIVNEYHLVNGADHNFSRVNDVQVLCTLISSWTKEQFQ